MNQKSGTMSKQLKALILITDMLFLTYWSLSLLDLLGVFQLPPSMMYAEY